MNKKVLSYLNTMGENKTRLTCVFRFYASGEMKSVLLQQRVKKLEFFPSLQKSKESLQISFQYYNQTIPDFIESLMNLIDLKD